MPGRNLFPNLGQGLAYIAEPAATVASSLASEIPAGWGGILTGDPSKVEAIHHAGTYQPRTEAGSKGLADLGKLLHGAGGLAMDAPYIGAAVRNFGESRDKLIDAGYPGLAAALQTAPAATALLFPGGEGALAMREVGATMAKNAMKPSPVGLAAQKGFINPTAMAPTINRAFRLSRAAKATGSAVAGERAAQRIGSGLERTHQGYVAEKTASEKH